MDVTLNTNLQLYVIPCGDGWSCLGFDVARDNSNLIADRLSQPNLSFGSDDYGTLAGYAKYVAAIFAWGNSSLKLQTYFEPGTDPKAAKALEICRRDGCKVRLILGDTSTGRCWLEEYDVIGRIGRSTGALKVPLLIEADEIYGGAILTNCLLRIVEWNSGQDLYRHPAFRVPDLSIQRIQQDGNLSWQVLNLEAVVANFSDIGKARAYVAFMCGESVEPKIFQ
jgi:hypothetical protein